MPRRVVVANGDCCCSTAQCECFSVNPPEILCADISGSSRCTEINRRYRLIKSSDLGNRGSQIVMFPGQPGTPIGDLDWWHAVCQVGCGAWHHLAIFRLKADGCTWSVDDWFSQDEAGLVIYANWGLYPLPVATANLHCDPTLRFTKFLNVSRLYMGNGSTCAGCATLADYLAAGTMSDTFTVSVFDDLDCIGCSLGTGTSTGTSECPCDFTKPLCVLVRIGTGPEPTGGSSSPTADVLDDFIEVNHVSGCMWGATNNGWTITVEMTPVGGFPTVMFDNGNGLTALYTAASALPMDFNCNLANSLLLNYTSSVGSTSWPDTMQLNTSPCP